MKPELIKLAVLCLRRYAHRLGNDGCNDVDPTMAKLLTKEILADIAAANEMDSPKSVLGCNFMVVDYVADRLLSPSDGNGKGSGHG